MNLEIQNTRFVKEVHKILEKQFGFVSKLDYVFLKNNKGKVFIISKDFSKIDFNKLRINTIGFYLGELKNGEFRLSLEGCTLIGPGCSKNVFDLEEKQMKWYFEGLDLEMDLGAVNRFVILKFRDDFIGCAKYKNGKVFNFMPKEHRTVDLVY